MHVHATSDRSWLRIACIAWPCLMSAGSVSVALRYGRAQRARGSCRVHACRVFYARRRVVVLCFAGLARGSCRVVFMVMSRRGTSRRVLVGGLPFGSCVVSCRRILVGCPLTQVGFWWAGCPLVAMLNYCVSCRVVSWFVSCRVVSCRRILLCCCVVACRAMFPFCFVPVLV
jgi:hypothetical protein